MLWCRFSTELHIPSECTGTPWEERSPLCPLGATSNHHFLRVIVVTPGVTEHQLREQTHYVTVLIKMSQCHSDCWAECVQPCQRSWRELRWREEKTQQNHQNKTKILFHPLIPLRPLRVMSVTLSQIDYFHFWFHLPTKACFLLLSIRAGFHLSWKDLQHKTHRRQHKGNIHFHSTHSHMGLCRWHHWTAV